MNAQDLLSQFLSKNAHQILEFKHVESLLAGLNASLAFTHFDDPYDTLFYSQLISKALTLDSSIRCLFDFGSGSSIPTLLALKETQRTNVRAYAVDIDPDAMLVGKKNAELLGLADQYTFELASIESILRSQMIRGESILIVSNPPYIPVPEGMAKHELDPVNGGPEGVDYILDLLNQDYSSGTILALIWGSLTSPMRVIPIIEDKYEVLHVATMKVHFGKYTQLPVIHDYLYDLREKGIVFFEGSKELGEKQLVLGTILRAR